MFPAVISFKLTQSLRLHFFFFNHSLVQREGCTEALKPDNNALHTEVDCSLESLGHIHNLAEPQFPPLQNGRESPLGRL